MILWTDNEADVERYREIVWIVEDGMSGKAKSALQQSGKKGSDVLLIMLR